LDQIDLLNKDIEELEQSIEELRELSSKEGDHA
jgi:prefoldin subunit 5